VAFHQQSLQHVFAHKARCAGEKNFHGKDFKRIQTSDFLKIRIWSTNFILAWRPLLFRNTSVRNAEKKKL
jgi:hypothetical protein